MTIKEYFSKAIEDGHSWAVEAYKEAAKAGTLNFTAESLSEALSTAFRWDDSDLDADVWVNIYNNLEDDEQA